MENQQDKSFLGIGWAFYPEFSTEGVSMVSEEEDIKESIMILLSTTPGERVMQPEYGCDLSELMFEPLNTTFKTFMQDKIFSAILRYEPRVTVERVDLESNDLQGIVEISIDFKVRATNSRYNMVFPYYRDESNNTQES